MREIFIMQVRHILGGRMKWLVAIALILPVVLSALLVFSGGVRKVDEELKTMAARVQDRRALESGEIPRSARKIEWDGEDQEFAGGALVVTRNGAVLYQRHFVRDVGWEWVVQEREPGSTWVVNDGQYILRGDDLWHNKKRKARSYFHAREVVAGEGDEVDFSQFVTIDALISVYLFLLYPQVMCLLIALFYGTSVLGHELEGKTLTYLFTRPLPRWKIVVGKYLGVVAALIPAATISLIGSASLLGVSGTHVTAILAGAVGALLAYSAVFILIGFLIPRRAMIVGLLYGIIFEFVLSFAPAIVNEATVTYYLRSLVTGLLDLEIPQEIARIVGGVTVWGAIGGLATIITVCLFLASWLAAQREYVIKDEA